MARFLLVHGSCHAAWCWRHVLPRLAALGHTARAIDLPSHGADPTPADKVTLDLYARAIVAALEPETVLVGHSMAGFPITAAAELAPDRIARLIYLCAYVPQPGLSLADMRRSGPSQPLAEAIRLAPDRLTFSIDPDLAIARFYHDVDPEIAAWATARLGPQPVLPQETPLTPDHALRLPRSYIRCLDDRAIPPALQDRMTADWPRPSVHDMPTSHSPFLSAPDRLARLLSDIAKD